MLILKRTLDQKIYIEVPGGDVITIMVTKIQRDGVKLGIDAPKNYQIVRDDAKDATVRDH